MIRNGPRQRPARAGIGNFDREGDSQLVNASRTTAQQNIATAKRGANPIRETIRLGACRVRGQRRG
jgi:hypothetical protein